MSMDGGGIVTIFDRAWSVVKAPWFDPEVEGQQPDQIQYPIEGPLYSGGDEMDDPKYWTTDMNEALAYALFGSAIPRSTINEEKDKKMKELFDRIGMRETIPTIFVADDPGEVPYDEEEYQVDMEHPDIQSYILDKDPHSDAYMHDDQWGAPNYRAMSRDEMTDMIQEILDRGPDEDFFQWGNTGSYKQPMERRAHMEGALERLKTGKRGNVDIPPEFLDSIDTAATDMHGHEGWDE